MWSIPGSAPKFPFSAVFFFVPADDSRNSDCISYSMSFVDFAEKNSGSKIFAVETLWAWNIWPPEGFFCVQKRNKVSDSSTRPEISCESSVVAFRFLKPGVEKHDVKNFEESQQASTQVQSNAASKVRWNKSITTWLLRDQAFYSSSGFIRTGLFRNPHNSNKNPVFFSPQCEKTCLVQNLKSNEKPAKFQWELIGADCNWKFVLSGGTVAQMRPQGTACFRLEHKRSGTGWGVEGGHVGCQK